MPNETENRTRFCLQTFGNVLVTRDQGEVVGRALDDALKTHALLDIVLDGVEAYTPSFVDEVLGKRMQSLGKSEFRKRIRMVAESQEFRRLVNLVLSNRAAGRSS